MKKLLSALALAAMLAGCASIHKLEGEQVVNGKMAVQLTDAWNKIDLPGTSQPYDTWTQEGFSLDQLRLWAGIRSGQALMAPPPVPFGQKAPRVPTYTAGMARDQLVSLFETLYAVDGSIVRVTRVDPALFAGEQGVRFEFEVARQRDDLQFGGVGWVAVRNGELFAATFVAPKLGFYPRLLPKAEGIVKTAQIRR